MRHCRYELGAASGAAVCTGPNIAAAAGQLVLTVPVLAKVFDELKRMGTSLSPTNASLILFCDTVARLQLNSIAACADSVMWLD